MRVQLFNPPVWYYSGFHFRMMPPLSLPILAAVLNAAGHDTEVVDLEALHKSPAELEYAFSQQRYYWPDVVGLTGLTITAQGLRESIQALRSAGYDRRIVVGGIYATINADEVLSWGADLVVRGECEGNLVSILESGAMGIREGEPMPIEALPMPDWEHHEPEISTYSGNMAILRPNTGISMWARGCPYSCLTEDSLIELHDGAKLPISEIAEGMSVRGMDLKTGRPRLQVVKASVRTFPSQHGIINIKATGGYQLKCTHDHLIWTRRGWVEAGFIRPNDEVTIYGCEWQTSLQNNRRGARTAKRISEETSGRGETQAQRADVSGGTRVSCYDFTATRGARKENGVSEDGRVQGWAVGTGAQEQRERYIQAQERGFCRGAESKQRAYESEQPGEKFCCAREDQSDLAQSIVEPIRQTKKEMGGWGNDSHCYDRGSATGCERAHEGQQPDEAPRSGGEGIGAPVFLMAGQSQEDGRSLDTRGYVSEQSRADASGDYRPSWLPFRWGRGILDRAMSKRYVPQPGLYLQERETQDSYSAEWGILAQQARTGRREGDSRLSWVRLENSNNFRQGIERSERDNYESEGLAGWAKVIEVTSLEGDYPVYDLETWPDHNFFANDILVHNCIFCSNLIFGGQPTRYRPPANIGAEMADLKARGCQRIYVYDDELVGTKLPAGWMHDIADRIEPLRLIWVTQGRCSKKFITPELMRDVKRAGCKAIFWGIESFNQKVLDTVKKHLTVDDIWHTLRVAKEAGIENGVFTMIGNYGETPADLEVTAEALGRAYREGLVDYRQTTACTPMPGTELARMAQAEGWYVDPPHGGRSMMHEYNATPWLSIAEISEWMRRFDEVCPVVIPP